MPQASQGSRGRPAAASRDDVIDAGLHHYLRGRRIDVQAIAAELGLGRATFDRFNRALADAPALRAFVEQEREAALRIIASGAGLVQPRMVELIAGLISDEAKAGTYEPRVDPATLGYAIVRLAEAFLFNDAVAGIRGDVDRLREVEAALLGVPA
jgi:Tetracyclin repressor-like, C-terminal domain